MSSTTFGMRLHEAPGAVDDFGKVYDQWRSFLALVQETIPVSHATQGVRGRTSVTLYDAHTDPMVNHIHAETLFTPVLLQRVAHSVQEQTESLFANRVSVEVCDQGDVVFAYGDEIMLERMLSYVVHSTSRISTHDVDKVRIMIHRIERQVDEELVPGSVSSGAYVGIATSVDVCAIRFDLLQEMVTRCISKAEHVSTTAGFFIAEFFIGIHNGALVVSLDPGSGFRFTVYLRGYTRRLH